MNYFVARLLTDITLYREASRACSAADELRKQRVEEVRQSIFTTQGALRDRLRVRGINYKTEIHSGLDKGQLLFYAWIERKNKNGADVMPIGDDMVALAAVREWLEKCGFKLEATEPKEHSVLQFFSIDTEEGKYER